MKKTYDILFGCLLYIYLLQYLHLDFTFLFCGDRMPYDNTNKMQIKKLQIFLFYAKKKKQNQIICAKIHAYFIIVSI